MTAAESAAAIRRVEMKLADLFRDSRDGMLSVVKTCAMIGFLSLTVGFIIQAKYRDLEWMDYVGFALGVTIISGAPIASHVVGTMSPRLSGQVQQPPPAAPPPQPDVTVTTTVNSAAPAPPPKD